MSDDASQMMDVLRRTWNSIGQSADVIRGAPAAGAVSSGVKHWEAMSDTVLWASKPLSQTVYAVEPGASGGIVADDSHDDWRALNPSPDNRQAVRYIPRANPMRDLNAEKVELERLADELRPLFVARLGGSVKVGVDWFDYQNEVRLVVEIGPAMESFRLSDVTLPVGQKGAQWFVDRVSEGNEERLGHMAREGAAATETLAAIGKHRAPAAALMRAFKAS